MDNLIAVTIALIVALLALALLFEFHPYFRRQNKIRKLLDRKWRLDIRYKDICHERHMLAQAGWNINDLTPLQRQHLDFGKLGDEMRQVEKELENLGYVDKSDEEDDGS